MFTFQQENGTQILKTKEQFRTNKFGWCLLGKRKCILLHLYCYEYVRIKVYWTTTPRSIWKPF